MRAVKVCADFEADDTDGSDQEAIGRGLRRMADEAALAARQDSRWGRLSHGLKDMLEMREQVEIFGNDKLSEAERDAARARFAWLDRGTPLIVIVEECDKATA